LVSVVTKVANVNIVGSGTLLILGSKVTKKINRNVIKVTIVTITALGISVTKVVTVMLTTKEVINVCTSSCLLPLFLSDLKKN